MICTIIFGGGYIVHLKSTNGLSTNFKEEVINNEFAPTETNDNDTFVYDETKRLKESSYKLNKKRC